jgi:hypothetical protein
MVPGSLPQGPASRVVSTALVEHQNAVTARHWIPAREPRPRSQFIVFGIGRSGVCDEGLQSVEGRDPASVVLMPSQFLQLFIP